MDDQAVEADDFLSSSVSKQRCPFHVAPPPDVATVRVAGPAPALCHVPQSHARVFGAPTFPDGCGFPRPPGLDRPEILAPSEHTEQGRAHDRRVEVSPDCRRLQHQAKHARTTPTLREERQKLAEGLQYAPAFRAGKVVPERRPPASSEEPLGSVASLVEVVFDSAESVQESAAAARKHRLVESVDEEEVHQPYVSVVAPAKATALSERTLPFEMSIPKHPWCWSSKEKGKDTAEEYMLTCGRGRQVCGSCLMNSVSGRMVTIDRFGPADTMLKYQDKGSSKTERKAFRCGRAPDQDVPSEELGYENGEDKLSGKDTPPTPNSIVSTAEPYWSARVCSDDDDDDDSSGVPSQPEPKVASAEDVDRLSASTDISMDNNALPVTEEETPPRRRRAMSVTMPGLPLVPSSWASPCASLEEPAPNAPEMQTSRRRWSRPDSVQSETSTGESANQVASSSEESDTDVPESKEAAFPQPDLLSATCGRGGFRRDSTASAGAQQRVGGPNTNTLLQGCSVQEPHELVEVSGTGEQGDQVSLDEASERASIAERARSLAMCLVAMKAVRGSPEAPAVARVAALDRALRAGKTLLEAAAEMEKADAAKEPRFSETKRRSRHWPSNRRHSAQMSACMKAVGGEDAVRRAVVPKRAAKPPMR